MQNPRNKTQENIINKKRQKDYLKRFTKLDIYSYSVSNKYLEKDYLVSEVKSILYYIINRIVIVYRLSPK